MFKTLLKFKLGNFYQGLFSGRISIALFDLFIKVVCKVMHMLFAFAYCA